MIHKRTLVIALVIVIVALAGCSTVSTDTPTVGEQPDSTTTTVTATGGEDTSETSGSSGEGETTAQTTVESNGTLSIHFIHVGQGLSIFAVGPSGETLLMDSGDWRDDGEGVIQYLEQRDVDRIDHLVTTHPDADHIGGHAAVIEHIETQGDGVGAVYDPGISSTSNTYERYLDAIEAHDVTLYEAQAGDQIPFEGVEADVLAPPAGYLADGDSNENSLVVRLAFGETTFLLPGDGEEAAEQYLVDEYGSRLNVTVLSAPHHGSQSSSTSEFLDATTPRVAIISSAYDSQFGHPHERVLSRYSSRSIRTLWTATHGNIRLTSNGTAITVATQAESPMDPAALRDGSSVESGSSTPLIPRITLSVAGGTTAAPTPVATDGGATTTSEQTSTATPTETDEGDGSAGKLSIATIHEDAEGNDNQNLNDEYVTFANVGDGPLDMGGWTVADEAGQTYTVPDGFTLDPGAQVTLYSGSGTDTDEELYWGSGRAIWNNGGDTVIVRDSDGNTVLKEEY